MESILFLDMVYGMESAAVIYASGWPSEAFSLPRSPSICYIPHIGLAKPVPACQTGNAAYLLPLLSATFKKRLYDSVHTTLRLAASNQALVMSAGVMRFFFCSLFNFALMGMVSGTVTSMD